ncbi:S-adenosyl-L-methionine decarboxylase leader peptide [Abeliophyllum distichum]|uniref:S-adenosyl-L-methionine decarboxylase leader peptide n=1 Tax=Abeliophyllum distichum TaxID=126358 RepID=A0ABD1SGI5_9LAMI
MVAGKPDEERGNRGWKWKCFLKEGRFLPASVDHRISYLSYFQFLRLNDLMESKGGKKKSSNSKSLFYEAPLGYSIEDIRPHGGIKKFRSAAYSNCARKPS